MLFRDDSLKFRFIFGTIICAFIFVFIYGYTVYAADCTTYTGDNVEDQNYISGSHTVNSYLYKCSDGRLMRVQSVSSTSSIVVEYYDSNYNLLESKIIGSELSIFGGFYAMNGYYYVLTGQANLDESNSVEVYRITKYDSNWKRISSCGLEGANTYYPFSSGSARMTHTGNYLVIRSCHTMYKSDDGNHHQANVTIEVNTSSMEVTDSYTSIMNVGYGYVSHSFNQFVQIVDGKIVGVDHGDAHPRSIVLVKYPSVCTLGTFTKNGCAATNIVSFEGATGNNYTGASVGGFEVSSNNYLVAYNQEYTLGLTNNKTPRDIYIGAVNKSTGTVTNNKITSCTAGSVTCSTPHLVTIGTDSYMLLWSQGGKVYYTKADAYGIRTESIYSLEGSLSDCKPIMSGSKLIWYVWNNDDVDFYEINTTTMTSNIINSHVGHSYVYVTAKDGAIDKVCSKCGDRITESIATAVRYCYWNGYSNGYINNFTIGSNIICEPVFDNDTAQANVISVTSSNEDIMSVNTIRPKSAELFALKPGIVDITVGLKYDPTVFKTYTLRIGSEGAIDLSDCDISLENSVYPYTGNDNRPAVVATYLGKSLKLGIDYTATYTNNKEVGTGKVTITGKGIFAGSIDKTFTIKTISLNNCTVSIPSNSYVCDPSGTEPVVTVNYEGSTIPKSLYTTTYSNNKRVGTASVTITPKGTDFTGNAVTKTFTITPLNINGGTIRYSTNESSFVYAGYELQPFYYIMVNDKSYCYGYDCFKYTITNNINVGTANIKVEGDGVNTIGSFTSTFKILPADISEYTLNMGSTELVYNGKSQVPSMALLNKYQKEITADNYTVTASNNINVGEASVTVEGKGNYTGNIEKTYNITQCDLSKCDMKLEYDNTIYDGSAKKPSVKVLYKGVAIPTSNYIVAYSDNIEIGTANVSITAKGSNCTGTNSITFHIGKDSLENATVTLSGTSFTYTGSEIKPTVKVVCGGLNLSLDTEYTVKYSNNINNGTATVTVSGIGLYAGNVVRTFTINKQSINGYAASLSTTSYYYNGIANKPAVTVKDSKGNILTPDNYTVVYSNNINIGTGYVTISGKGNYTGSIKNSFSIIELIPSSFRVCWKNSTNTSGYYYSNYDSSFDIGDVLICRIQPDIGSQLEDMEVISSDSSIVSVNYSNDYRLTMNKAGTVTITIRAKKNTSLSKTYSIVVNGSSSGTGSGSGSGTGSGTGSGLGSGTSDSSIPAANVSYRTHVQTFGWQDYVANGAMSGTSGKSKRLEGININVSGNSDLGIQYTTHVQTYGWLPWAADDDMSGTEGESKRLEAIMIKLTGADAGKYDVYYRVHAQSYGWLGWSSNGEPAGTAGYSKRLEGIQIVIVKKGQGFDTNMSGIVSAYGAGYISATNATVSVPGENNTNVLYRTHVQTYGWQGWKYNGNMSGTSGESKRLEGIELQLTNQQYEGDIIYKTHIQTYGWESDWRYNGNMSGTSGEAKRLEAIQIELTGEMKQKYDIYYRVHAQSFGWLGWSKNGEPAGTAGYGKRLEGIEVVLVPKGENAPGSNQNAYISK